MAGLAGMALATLTSAVTLEASISVGDIISRNGSAAFAMISGQAPINNAGMLRILLNARRPTYFQSGGRIGIYRHKCAKIPGAKAILSDSRYTVIRKCIIYGSGPNYVILGSMPGEPGLSAWNLKASDWLLHPDQGLLSMAGAGAGLQNGNLLLQQGRDFTTTGTYCYLLATDAMRPGTQVPEPIELVINGALTTYPLVTLLQRGGEFRTLFAKLATPGSTDTVAVVNVNGTDIMTLTFADVRSRSAIRIHRLADCPAGCAPFLGHQPAPNNRWNRRQGPVRADRHLVVRRLIPARRLRAFPFPALTPQAKK